MVRACRTAIVCSAVRLCKVVEYDENWNEVWSIDKDQLPGSPFNVRRLPNGNTLVACSDSQRVLEFDRSKKVVWDITVQGRPMDVTRLENGNTLISLSHTGRVVEYSPDKREICWLDRMAGAMRAAERMGKRQHPNRMHRRWP